MLHICTSSFSHTNIKTNAILCLCAMDSPFLQRFKTGKYITRTNQPNGYTTIVFIKCLQIPNVLTKFNFLIFEILLVFFHTSLTSNNSWLVKQKVISQNFSFMHLVAHYINLYSIDKYWRTTGAVCYFLHASMHTMHAMHALCAIHLLFSHWEAHSIIKSTFPFLHAAHKPTLS